MIFYILMAITVLVLFIGLFWGIAGSNNKD